MKLVYILIVLLVAASALGCVDRNTPDTAVPGQQEPVSPAPGQTSGQTDEFGIESDLEILDMMFNDTAMDISFEVIDDAFT